MHTYSEQILKIPALSSHATKQLLTDIGTVITKTVMTKTDALHNYNGIKSWKDKNNKWWTNDWYKNVISIFLFFTSDYLCNVLDDLGLQPSDVLSNLTELLKAAPEDYADVMENKPQRLVSAIANMRNIPIH